MGWGALIPLGVSLLSGVIGGRRQSRAEKLQREGLDLLKGSWNERAPLRQMALRGLGAVEQPMDLGNLMFDDGNPFAARRGPAPSTATLGGYGDIMRGPPEAPPAAQPRGPTGRISRALLRPRGGEAVR